MRKKIDETRKYSCPDDSATGGQMKQRPRIGVTLKSCPGIGDRMQFASLPENYYFGTGQKLIDVDRAWIYDYNPYVERDATPDYVIDLWCDFKFIRPKNRTYYASLAERNAMFLDVPARLSHPRLYRFENEPIKYNTVLAPYGKSGGSLSEQVVKHVLATRDGIAQVGVMNETLLPVEFDMRGQDIWKAAEVIASSREFIGSDSGLSWIAACYPRVWNKKVLMQFSEEFLKDYLGMDCANPDTHWSDRRFSYYNNFDYDIGITVSYLKI